VLTNKRETFEDGVLSGRLNLASRVYQHLSYQLMSARLKPGERLKIRELSKTLAVSETPVREALLQLVRDGSLEMKEGYYIRVRYLSLAEYLEIRDIRQELEPLAAVRALPHLTKADINGLAETHKKLIKAEQTRAYDDALLHNYDFHLGIYRHSGMPQLIALLEKLWVQVGPMLTFLYPDGHPTYDNRHQHLNIIDALRKKDPVALREAVVMDLLEGGRKFVEWLERQEATRPPIQPASKK
jgi:DNA-binding GntR family transcriptional regulator